MSSAGPPTLISGCAILLCGWFTLNRLASIDAKFVLLLLLDGYACKVFYYGYVVVEGVSRC